MIQHTGAAAASDGSAVHMGLLLPPCRKERCVVPAYLVATLAIAYGPGDHLTGVSTGGLHTTEALCL